MEILLTATVMPSRELANADVVELADFPAAALAGTPTESADFATVTGTAFAELTGFGVVSSADFADEETELAMD